eukprot:gnl/Dysnectes_brevis/1036_a1156_2421.p1 GENE.gnl/Dysnectes_brevis/1036_a1156_2421~~gnl/Dysnectes_brevis/1036_a1156_2421.p1  ORF type:complete len:471 (+),score=157.92 gnl/Dysnectes_brevis/1036_a1156_2421:105-1415(+)
MILFGVILLVLIAVIIYLVITPSPLPQVTQTGCTLTTVESLPLDIIDYTYTQIHQQTTWAWLKLIASATKTLDISAYYITLRCTQTASTDLICPSDGDDVFNAIKAAADRGVAVRMAVDYPNFGDFDDALELEAYSDNIELVWVPFGDLLGGVLHSKIIIADNTHFYLGSANMDWRALTQIKEMGVYVQDCPALASDLDTIFAQYRLMGVNDEVLDSYEAMDATMNAEVPGIIEFNGTSQPAFFASSPPQLQGPNRSWDEDEIVGVVDNADTSVSLTAMTYTPEMIYSHPKTFWGRLDDSLRAASVRGAAVRLVISNSDSLHYSVPWLTSLDVLDNVDVRIFCMPLLPGMSSEVDEQAGWDHTRLTHSKYVVTEGDAVLSTSNFTEDYFENTAGVTLVLKDYPAFREGLQDSFDRDWASPMSITLQELADEGCPWS